MNFLFNFHTHCQYCDGQGQLEDYVQAAINKGMQFLGFSSHAPLPFPAEWTMQTENAPLYRDEVLRLRKKYQDKIKLYLGLEIDYIAGIVDQITPSVRSLQLDYFIGSAHYLGRMKDGSYWTVDGSREEFEAGLCESFQNNIELAVAHYYDALKQMVSSFNPDIVGHLDIIKKNNPAEAFFSENSPWYQRIVTETLTALSKSNSIIEVNTGGIARKKITSLYPSEWILRQCLALEIPITVNSDAHQPEHLDYYFPETFKILKNIGYRKVMCLTAQGWQPFDI